MKHLSEVNESHSDSADSVRAADAGLAHTLFFCFVLFCLKEKSIPVLL